MSEKVPAPVSNFIRNHVEADLAGGKYAQRHWQGRPGVAADHLKPVQHVDPVPGCGPRPELHLETIAFSGDHTGEHLLHTVAVIRVDK